MNKFLLWLSECSLAHMFSVTRMLERHNKELKLEIENLKKLHNEELAGLRAESRELLNKIYLIVGIQQTEQLSTSMINEAQQAQVVQLPSDLERRAIEEDFVAWQEEERRRLQEAKIAYDEFHNG